ncbi:MAG TPA: hypothetical protein VI873_04025 [Candidatus Peribacteraceae bacterium]|nr:hypothetical protein [Candidatus Peribacteraceae bacterium]
MYPKNVLLNYAHSAEHSEDERSKLVAVIEQAHAFDLHGVILITGGEIHQLLNENGLGHHGKNLENNWMNYVSKTSDLFDRGQNN